MRPRPDPRRSGCRSIEDAAHAVESAYRGRKLGGALRRRPASRSTRRRTSRQARAGSSRRTATTSRRRSGPAPDAPRRRLALRHHVPGYKANLSDVLAAIALAQLDKLDGHREIRERQLALYDDGLAGLEGISRSPATRATPMRCTSTSSGSTRRGAGATRDEYQRALAEEQIGTQHPLPAGAPADVVPRAVSVAAAAPRRRAGRRRGAVAAALAGALRRGHRRRGRRRAPRARPLHGMSTPLRVLADAPRHGARARLHRLEDRPRRDGRHARSTRTRGGSRSRRRS